MYITIQLDVIDSHRSISFPARRPDARPPRLPLSPNLALSSRLHNTSNRPDASFTQLVVDLEFLQLSQHR